MRLTGRQAIDEAGNPIMSSGNAFKKIEGVVSHTVIFAGIGVLERVVVLKNIASGTFTIEDSNNTAIFSAGVTDYAGSFEFGILLLNGCRITTTGFTAGALMPIYFQ